MTNETVTYRGYRIALENVFEDVVCWVARKDGGDIACMSATVDGCKAGIDMILEPSDRLTAACEKAGRLLSGGVEWWDVESQ